MKSEILMLAVWPEEIDAAVALVGSGAAAVIVDAIEPERGNGLLNGAEVLARKLDDHRLVRALINLPQPGSNVLICGDDPESKRLLDAALQACGCLTTDRGSLSHAGELEAPPASTKESSRGTIAPTPESLKRHAIFSLLTGGSYR